MEKKQSVEKKRGLRLSLTVQILVVALIPVILMGVIVTWSGINISKDGMQREVMGRLESVCIALEGVCMSHDEGGDYTLNSEEHLLKGNFDLTKNEMVLDSLVRDTNVDVTVFYDNVRRATTLKDAQTNKRVLGTTAADTVYQKVVKEGQSYTASDLTVNDKPYYSYYRPMKNSDGKVVGMFFAGCPSEEVDSYITAKGRVLAIVALIMAAIAAVLLAFSIRAISKAIAGTKEVVLGLASGNLNTEVSAKILKRSDELGEMAGAIRSLQQELLKALGKVKESSDVLLSSGASLSSMATQTSATSDEIGHAVEDISKSAVSQAEEVEDASNSIDDMGKVIGNIVNGVDVLDAAADRMKNAGDESMKIIAALSQSNDKTMDAIVRIGEQVHATNESANKISEAIQLITSIAEETNLLSLNASIEAARAGEQGRGFAVVANQIQKLAEQSNESAQRIAEVIADLLNDSENTVLVMDEVQKIVDEQKEKLESTKKQFASVNEGIEESREETEAIKSQTDVCDVARVKVVDIISNLSAISEENAASAQETTASMEELNATINLLSESASDLSDLAEQLAENIKFFKF